MQTSTSGGSSETEQKALTVMPARCEPSAVVTTVTPVVNLPITALKSAVSEVHGDPGWLSFGGHGVAFLGSERWEWKCATALWRLSRRAAMLPSGKYTADAMLAQISAMKLRIRRGSAILALPKVIECFTA